MTFEGQRQLNSILRNEVNTTRRDLHRDRRDVR